MGKKRTDIDKAKKKWAAACPIRCYVRQKKISLAEFGRKIGVTPITINNWCNGGQPSQRSLKKIAVFMDCKIEKIFSSWAKWLAEADHD